MLTANRSISEDGFAIIGQVFSEPEIAAMLKVIDEADTSGAIFRRTAELFAIRQFLKAVPQTIPLLFTRLDDIITQLFGKGYFAVKSIYFDKPASSNWFVAYHQDLTISVDKKADLPGFGPWTVKQDQYAVQPPPHILEDNLTIRIHLDDTTAENGALRVIPGSHREGICRPETVDRIAEVSCSVLRGGIMIMRPLLLHASSRTTNDQKRRVIHIEFSRQALPQPLQWAEFQPLRPGAVYSHY